MRFHRFRAFQTVAFAVCVIVCAPVGALAQIDEFPQAPPVEDPSVDPQASPPDHKGLLEALYQRLEQAETPELAKAVAQNIERLWRSSDSASINLLLVRAMSLIRNEEYNLALAILDTVVIAAPDFAEGWSQRAMVHFQKREFRAALQDLRRVLALEPRHYRAMQGVAVILNEFGEKERALKAYRRVLDVYPLKKEARDAVNELRREVEGQDI